MSPSVIVDSAPVPDRTDGQPDASPPSRSWSNLLPVRWRDSLKAGLWTWLAGVIAYVVVTYTAWIPFYEVESKAGPRSLELPGVIELWHRWDTNWYVIIATSGYEWYPAQATAFYPLYPGTIRLLNHVLPGDALLTALIVSSLCALAALVLLHRLALEVFGETGENDARRAIYYLLAFPAGFFLIAGYNESMFIALALGSLYCMRHGRWWWAGGLAGLASATRSVGVLLAVAFAYEYLRQIGVFDEFRRIARIRWNALAVLLAPTGIIAYAAYCWYKFGDPMIFVKAQEFWQRSSPVPPWETIAKAVRLLTQEESPFAHGAVHGLMNLSAALGALTLLVLAVVGPWKLGRENVYLVVFAFLGILIPLMTPQQTSYPLGSMIRFVLEAVPIYLVLAKMGRNAAFDRTYLLGTVMLQAVLLLGFLHNQGVA